MELERTDPLRLLIQAYCFFSGGGAACERLLRLSAHS
jgi:hypothetical protein